MLDDKQPPVIRMKICFVIKSMRAKSRSRNFAATIVIFETDSGGKKAR